MGDENDGSGRNPPRGQEGDGEPNYLAAFADEQSFLTWQCVSVGLLLAGLVVMGDATMQDRSGATVVAGIALLGAAIAAAGIGLCRWNRAGRRRRDVRTDLWPGRE